MGSMCLPYLLLLRLLREQSGILLVLQPDDGGINKESSLLEDAVESEPEVDT